jgi:hypothetical protein
MYVCACSLSAKAFHLQNLRNLEVCAARGQKGGRGLIGEDMMTRRTDSQWNRDT